MNGTAILAGEGYLRTVSDMSWQIAGTGDFDGDGQADILWRNRATGENYIYFMHGKVIIAEGFIRTVSDLNWKIVGVGDLDGDGRSDILWRNSSTGENYAYLMNGLLIASEGSLRTIADQNWQVAGVGNFDGNASPATADILWRNQVTGENYIHLMNGTTLSSEGYIRAVPDLNWKVVGIGDFDGDGRSDVLWRNQATGENYIYPMQGLTIKPSEGYLRTITDQNWQVAAVGNFAGNIAPATADILWRNSSTGENYLYPMNGTAVLPSEGYLRTVADLNWTVQPALSIPDLVVTSISYSSATGTFTSTVKNQGTAATPAGLAIGVAYFVDGVYRTWGAYANSLAAGASVTIGSDGGGTYAIPAGSHTIMGYVDDALRIVESNENNNQLTQTISVSASDTTPPTIPTGLSASAITSTSATLSWNASTDNIAVTGYRAYRNGTLVASPSSTSASITGLTASTQYSFTVTAVDAANNSSALSAPLLVTTPTSIPPGPAQRPAYNTGTGFFVLGKTLYDADGYEFRIRGVNKAHYDSNQYAVVNNMKANAVRWVMYDPTNTQPAQVAAANAWIAQKIVPIPGNWDGVCIDSTATLTSIVDLWVARAASWTTSDLQRYAIINIANEWGPSDSVVWRDSYITAIQRMRNAGYKQTLMIDSGGCGQDAADILKYAQAVFDSDPQKNVIISLHIYGAWARPAIQSWQQNYDTLLAQMSLLNVPIVIGEFGPGRNIGPSPTPITPLEIMTTAEGYKWGWLGWAADDGNTDSWFAMLYNNTVYNSSADLTIFGKVVVDNAVFGLKAIAVKAAALTGIPPLP